MSWLRVSDVSSLCFLGRCAQIALLALSATVAQATLSESAGHGYCDRLGDALVSCAMAPKAGLSGRSAPLDLYGFATDAELSVVADKRLLVATATDQPMAFTLGVTSREPAKALNYRLDPEARFTPLLRPEVWLEARGSRSLVDAHNEAQAGTSAAERLHAELSADLPGALPLALTIGLTGLVLAGLLRGLQSP
jgi:hypothetical protein